MKSDDAIVHEKGAQISVTFDARGNLTAATQCRILPAKRPVKLTWARFGAEEGWQPTGIARSYSDGRDAGSGGQLQEVVR